MNRLHHHIHSISLKYSIQKVFTKLQATYQNKKRNEVLQYFQQTYFYIKFLSYFCTTKILLVGIDSHVTIISIFNSDTKSVSSTQMVECLSALQVHKSLTVLRVPKCSSSAQVHRVPECLNVFRVFECLKCPRAFWSAHGKPLQCP